MTPHQQDDLYERLIELSQEALVSGHYETAYHVLTAARHYAQDIGDEQCLRLVEQTANAQQSWIDEHSPEHRMSTQATVERSGVKFYETLARQAAAHVLILRQEHRREHTERLPWPGDARSSETNTG